MSEHHLHIVSFDVPYPPNYGGVIDVFYKIKELHNKAIKLHLHIIEYPGRNRAPELEMFCESVNYYPRLTGVKSAFSIQPYIVNSRRSPQMIENLLKDKYPILFEGLHSCYYIDDQRLKDRVLVYRESNIEHQYYYHLFKAEHNWGKKAYFLMESVKLRLFQKKLRHATIMLAVSQGDADYLHKKFPTHQVYFLPSFHPNDKVTSLEGKGNYFLYHGNIEVPENETAASFLIKKVFSNSPYKLIIAGMNPPKTINELAAKNKNIEIISNPDDETIFRLMQEAQANILVTFQASGLKLKLLNTLYKGRFCIVNSTMLNGTNLEELCIIGNSASELRKIISNVVDMNFTADIITQREEVLQRNFSNNINSDRMIDIIFNR
jgi:predicted nucleic acid-binding protein